jgi:FkbM family methyltransferase
VIDIGAGLGEYTLYSACVVGTKVFAFEPFPESFALLQENLQLNDITNVQAFEAAIGSQSGNLILDLSSGEPLQFQSAAKQASANQYSLSVRSISLADVFDRSGIESCNLLKLDCEGAEYDILLKAMPSVLEKIEHIVMEYHDHVADHTHVELIHFLEAQGYQVNAYPNLVLPYLGYIRAKREKR